MDVLAVIPAVASATRRPFLGKDLVLHSLEQARAARHVAHAAVVTADPELARLVRETGSDVVAPPSDEERSSQLRAVLDLLATQGVVPAVAVLLDPAFVLRDAAVIDGAVEHLWRCGADSLVAVRPVGESLWVQDEGGLARPAELRPAERRFVQTPAIEGVRVGVFQQTGDLPTGRIVLYEVPAVTALRAEQAFDWQHVEFLWRLQAEAHARALLRAVRLLVLDFDGVLTDNRVLVLQDGREAVICNRGDGMGIGLLKAAGIPVAVISKEVNPVVGARCRKLDIPFLQGIDDKFAEFRRMIRERTLDPQQVAYMGNDVNDLECMAAAGVAIAPADAHPAALRAANLVTQAAGGFGAVREVCDLLLAVNTEPPAGAGEDLR